MLPLSASGQKGDGMHRYNTHELTIGETNFVDTIPIVFAGNQVYIPVYINGQRHLFNLDTGSSQGCRLHRRKYRLQCTFRQHQLP